jgi:LPPG:FO 2-phospho-L-lactate transferase
VELTIIGNIADDEQFHGLWVSPDIDTVTYTLAGLIDRKQGWGVADEGLRALGVLEKLGEHTWMTLGDKDLGLHIYRTMRRNEGDRPSDIARHIAKAFGVKPTIVLPTDDWMQTRLVTDIWSPELSGILRAREVRAGGSRDLV